ncbi:methylmalonyl-CoA mutase family protein [Kordiimonas aestuarii]|uniref:methylmalonyl-CoA mutase family protein n=1 Tax=Kordiimonas aestuarii TaxID=1005925 RepID=UPI0021D0C9AC|nr:methylmalonyl-CoA mutase family protein [Kordiimonas aestuarii]
MADKSLKLASDFEDASDDAWRALVDKTLGGKPFDKVMKSQSYDGIEIKALYTKDNARIEPQASVRPGHWSITSPHWNPDATTMNAEILEDLERGVEALAIRIEAGYAPGLKVSDLNHALEGIYLNMARFYLMPGEEYEAAASEMLGVLKDCPPEQGGDFYGNLGCDPLGTLACTGRLKEKAEEALEKAADIALKRKPAAWHNVRTFRADATVYHNAGATEAQELACMLATVTEYMRATGGQGAEIEPALAADADIFMGLAKFRAAGRLLTQVYDAFGATWHGRLHAVTSLRMMTIKDPWVNILRCTAAAFAAGVGGAWSVSVLPHDTMLGLSGRSARRIARNIQIMLQEESGLHSPDDAAAGSFAVESLTSDLCDNAWKIFQKIEAEGGMLKALRASFIHNMIEAAWAARKANIVKRRDAITGVSEFPDIFEKPLSGLGGMPDMPTDIAPAGEEILSLPFHRLAEDFEALRTQSDAMLDAAGKRPQVFIAGLGRVADFTARATFAKSFFEAGGIEALTNDGFREMEALEEAFAESGAPFAVICGTDTQYEDMGLKAAEALKAAGARRIYLAGRPSKADALTGSGVDEFIYMGADVLDTLTRAYDVMGEDA